MKWNINLWWFSQYSFLNVSIDFFISTLIISFQFFLFLMGIRNFFDGEKNLGSVFHQKIVSRKSDFNFLSASKVIFLKAIKRYFSKEKEDLHLGFAEINELSRYFRGSDSNNCFIFKLLGRQAVITGSYFSKFA